MRKIDFHHLIDNAKFNRFHWMVLFWSALIIIFDGYDLVIYGVVLPLLMEKWNLTPLEAGTLGSYALFGMMFGALIFGTLSDKIGRKKAIIICIFLFSGFTFVTGFAETPLQFGILRFLAGLGIGGVMPNVVALMTEYSPKKIRSTLVTIMFSGYSVGGMLSAGLGIVLIPNFGWQSVFYVGLVPILLLPLIIKFLPDSVGFLVKQGRIDESVIILSKIDPTYIPQKGDDLEIGGEKIKGASVAKLFKHNRAASTIMFWVAFFCCLLMVYGLNSWLPKLMNKAGYELGSSLTFLLVLNFGAILGAVGGGWLGDKFNLKTVLISFFAVAAISLSLLGFKNSTLVLYILIAIAGATTIGTQILCYAYVAQYYPINIRSSGIGWASGIGRIGAILGPVLGGTLMSLNMPFEYNFVAFAVPGAIGALAVCFISVKHSHDKKTEFEKLQLAQLQTIVAEE
jgi:AAHS family benzoate transporter-like MFS transporter|nr:aromatic acid/H+ symport family MFS transporter [uncultured Flavobacterium sp.]